LAERTSRFSQIRSSKPHSSHLFKARRAPFRFTGGGRFFPHSWRALITGSWGSVGAFKCPTLRNLSAHEPYFHDGSAATLADVVEHYKKALGFQFSDDEKQDLVNFLSAL
jgi:cytochrome c peroxidase